MKLIRQVLNVSLCVGLTWAGVAHADVQVKFIDPAHFSDIRDNDGFTKRDVLPDIEAHIVTQAAKRFPGRDLRFEVTDVDLAGEIEPFGRRVQWIRTLRTITLPSLSLKYQLLEGGAVVASGEARLRDLGYLDGFNAYSSGDPLRFERRMIDQWMDHELKPAIAAAPAR